LLENQEDISLKNNIALAPMEGVSDFVTRLWLFQVSGITKVHTPFLRVTESFPKNLKEQALLWAPEIFCEKIKEKIPYSLTPQLMASDPRRCLEVAENLAFLTNKVELNCGCPAPTVVGHGAGSSLLKSLDLFSNFIKTLSSGLDKNTLSVKMRTGFYDTNNFKELIEILTQFPLSRVVIHGRTRSERYRGQSDWDLINYAAKRLEVPVWGSGDINSYSCLQQKLNKASSVSGVLLGRGALRNPWLLNEIKNKSNVKISTNTLRGSLLVYAHMNYLFFNHYEIFIKFLCEKDGFKFLGTKEESWLCFYESILSLNLVRNEEIKGRVLGKLKMIWNYLRTSLPEKFHTRDFLRTKSVAEFLELFDETTKDNSDFVLAHNHLQDNLFAR
jgi:tRNA-dihydrouridine synthase